MPGRHQAQDVPSIRPEEELHESTHVPVEMGSSLGPRVRKPRVFGSDSVDFVGSTGGSFGAEFRDRPGRFSGPGFGRVSSFCGGLAFSPHGNDKTVGNQKHVIHTFFNDQ